VFVHSTLEFFELVFSLEDVDFFRLYLLSFDFFKGRNSAIDAEISKSFLLNSLPSLHDGHLLLELLSQVQLCVVSLGSFLLVEVHLIGLFWSFVEGVLTKWGGCFWYIVELLKYAMHTVCACGAHAQPVLNAVLVYNHRALHSLRLTRQPEADAFEVAAAGVRVRGLNYEPPEAMVLYTVVLQADAHSHLKFLYN
jgi:hypothetical protein